jgi:glycosyltransferase involved in cell wall biosynthesis
LKQLLDFLERTVSNKIIIIDNNSTYQPLLDYLNTSPHEVIKLNRNLGHQAWWLSRHNKRYKGKYYVVTDPDVVPIEECPANFLEHFMDLMNRFPRYKKVGFALKIDDLPDHFPNKQAVIDWERQFWKTKVTEGAYRSQIDTTFALFHPSLQTAWDWAIRTDHPYMARHTTWYLDPNNLPDDEVFYKGVQKTITHWSKGL